MSKRLDGSPADGLPGAARPEIGDCLTCGWDPGYRYRLSGEREVWGYSLCDHPMPGMLDAPTPCPGWKSRAEAEPQATPPEPASGGGVPTP